MGDMLRIWRWPGSAFGKALLVPDDLQEETVTAAEVYSDAALSEIASMGFNAIWVHGLLQNIVPSRVFPEFAPNAKRHIAAMRKLITRAAKHGIKVMLYMQPPRGLRDDDPFWAKHPECGGHASERYSDDGYPTTIRTMCTSAEPVRAFIRNSSRRLFEELPGLGGVILITASEYTSHCWARNTPRPGYTLPCARCNERSPIDVVTEIVNLVRDGIREVSRDAHVIAWNWSWAKFDPDPSPRIIAGLPKDVSLLAGFERGAHKTIYGKRRVMDEYALSYVGPSPRFRRAAETARTHGMGVMAKLQIGTTHELATVPSLPLIGSLYGKAKYLRALGADGFMGCWNFGNMTSLNPIAFNEFMDADALPPKRTALRLLAEKHLPGCDAALAAEAWEDFSDAMEDYPFSVPFLYFSPTNYALAYPLKPAPIKPSRPTRSWLSDPWTDELETSLRGYTLDEVVSGLGRLARAWKKGADKFGRALRGCDTDFAREEFANARVIAHIWRSTWNVYRCYRLRRNWSEKKRPAFDRIVRDEIANLDPVLPLLRADDRFGYHCEAHAYFFTADKVARKLRVLRRLA